MLTNNNVFTGSQVKPPKSMESEEATVTSSTAGRALHPPESSLLQTVNSRSNVVVVNDGSIVNPNRNCEKRPCEVQRSNDNDLSVQLKYDQITVVHNTEYHRIPINDTSSRRNHERHPIEQHCKERLDSPNKNSFTDSNSEIVAVKSYPIKDNLPTDTSPEVIKMEVEECKPNPLVNGRPNSYELLKNDGDKEINRFCDKSPPKESHGMDKHHHKDHHSYDHIAGGPDGSVRSDEGYHSHGYHDEVLTPPEDSSDSNDSDNNYVLDFRYV